MNNGNTRLYRRLRISGGFIVTGLLVEVLSLIRIHPLAFLFFMFIGGSCILVGVVIFLYSIILRGHSPSDIHST